MDKHVYTKPQTEKQPRPGPRLGTLLFYVVLIAAVVLINLFVFRLGFVNGSSMQPTLQDRDVIVIWQAFYQPAQGDVVVTSDSNDLNASLTKRVAAVAGQQVRVAADGLYVDGMRFMPYWEPQAAYEEPLELTVPSGQVFLVGDNYVASLDSRRLGCFSLEDIMGEAVLRLFPFNGFGGIH